MPVTPVEARCARCHADFALAELLDGRTGCCPGCGWRLTEDWAAVLLEEAARADLAQRHLVASLRNLRGLPGNLLLLPHPVLRNVSEAMGWEAPPTDDGGLLDDQRRRLTDLARGWVRRPAGATPAPPRRRRIRRSLAEAFRSASRRHTEAAMAPYRALGPATVRVRPRRAPRCS
jgi:hypothetical protein